MSTWDSAPRPSPTCNTACTCESAELAASRSGAKVNAKGGNAGTLGFAAGAFAAGAFAPGAAWVTTGLGAGGLPVAVGAGKPTIGEETAGLLTAGAVGLADNVAGDLVDAAAG